MLTSLTDPLRFPASKGCWSYTRIAGKSSWAIGRLACNSTAALRSKPGKGRNYGAWYWPGYQMVGMRLYGQPAFMASVYLHEPVACTFVTGHGSRACR